MGLRIFATLYHTCQSCMMKFLGFGSKLAVKNILVTSAENLIRTLRGKGIGSRSGQSTRKQE